MLERIGKTFLLLFLGWLFWIFSHPHDQEKTTLTCPYGTFIYQRMTFERCMIAVLYDYIESIMEVFMDDFLSVYGGTSDLCLDNLDKVLHRCEEANLILNRKKCHFLGVTWTCSFTKGH